MPTIIIHGIGNHDQAAFQAFFGDVRDQLLARLAERRMHAPPPESFFPLFWGSWGPQRWYQGLALQAQAASDDLSPEMLRLAGGVQAKSLDAPAAAPFDPGLAALEIVLSTPGPLHEVLDDLGIGEAALLHAVKQTNGQPERAALVVRRLLVRAQLAPGAGTSHGLARSEGRAALQALLDLILEQPRAQAKSLSSVVAFPFLATVTALARHLRGSIMQAATSFVGDVMLYLARGAEVRAQLHRTVLEARAQFPDEPLVLLAHSLGGIIAYEYATDGALADRPPIDLLVTVGSQVALFAEYELLHAAGAAHDHLVASRAAQLRSRWLNIYDPDDFLSFPIAGMFPAAADGDHSISAGKPFPASHTAYWGNPAVYAAIAEAFPARYR